MHYTILEGTIVYPVISIKRGKKIMKQNLGYYTKRKSYNIKSSISRLDNQVCHKNKEQEGYVIKSVITRLA
jgi:hypothetical protein